MNLSASILAGRPFWRATVEEAAADIAAELKVSVFACALQE
jgi:hypothetical protein